MERVSPKRTAASSTLTSGLESLGNDVFRTDVSPVLIEFQAVRHGRNPYSESTSPSQVRVVDRGPLGTAFKPLRHFRSTPHLGFFVEPPAIRKAKKAASSSSHRQVADIRTIRDSIQTPAPRRSYRPQWHRLPHRRWWCADVQRGQSHSGRPSRTPRRRPEGEPSQAESNRHRSSRH